jgi:hypothetical protein
VATNDPCEVRYTAGVREGMVWNLSRGGLYLAIDAPLPDVGQQLSLVFQVDDDREPIACAARVAWRNPPSVVIEGFGSVAVALPPGCGLAFSEIRPTDFAKIERRLRNA